MIPHKCPVCEGRGTVHASFYGESTNAGFGTVACKSCFGTGIVWDYSTPYIPYTPFPYTPPTITPINPLPYDPFNPWGPTICDSLESSEIVCF